MRLRISTRFGMLALAGAAIVGTFGPVGAAEPDALFDKKALTSVPYLYDKNDKPVGPYVTIPLFKFDNRVFTAQIEMDGFTTPYIILYYTTSDCSGAAYIQSDLIPEVEVANGTLYYPSKDAKRLATNSTKTSEDGKTFGECRTGSRAPMIVAPLKTANQSALGFSPPFRVKDAPKK